MRGNPIDTLRACFGFADFRPGQAEAIENLLSGEHTLVVMPTGAGKSLIYQLAALHRQGLTLVISPLIALMKDQVDALTRRNIPATYINSTLSTTEQAHRLQALARGAFRLAYVAPERLRSVPFREALQHVSVDLLAVDEAHCISHWGHDFRPDYLHIAVARAQMDSPTTVALTATATPQVQDDIVRLLEISSAKRIITGFNRPNLTFEVRYTAELPAKLEALRELLSGLEDGAAIVYVGTRRDAEETAGFARTVVGIETEYYHAGLETGQRTKVQEAFLAGDLPVVAATNAFGMGIDRPDVRLVTHFALPGTLEAYYQEAGRAGRDGKPAQAILLYSPKDRALQEWFIENEAPTLEEVRALYNAIRPSEEKVWMSLDDFSVATGVPEVKVKVGLSQLETAGVMERLGDEGPRMLLRRGAWNEQALQKAAAFVKEHQSHRREQLAKMITYAESNACRRRILLDHFGDKSPAEALRCCDNCLARHPQPVPFPTGAVSDLSQAERTALIILDALHRLKWAVGRAKLAELLKGSQAKDIQRFGYDHSPYYGRLAAFSKEEIKEMIEQLIAQKYLKVVGSVRPVLGLTPQGEAALKARAPITLRLPRRVQPEAIARKRAEREAGGTVALTEQMFSRGLTPAEIARQRGLSERTIYGHLARLIGDGKLSLSSVVPEDIASQVQAAITQVSGASSLYLIKASLPDTISYEQIRCVVEAWMRQQGRVAELTEAQSIILDCVRSLSVRLPRSGIAKLLVGSLSARVETLRENPFYGRLSSYMRNEVMREIDRLIERGHLILNEHREVISPATKKPAPAKTDVISNFLHRSHPRPLLGPWHAGWALGFHSGFAGAEWSRSSVGQMAYQLKYQGDASMLSPLVEQAVTLCKEHPELADVDGLVAVPPSTPRDLDPVRAFVEALGTRLGRPVWSALVKTRSTTPQKELHTLAQKRANVAGAFAVQGDVHGKRLLVLDDLYDSGATLEEVSRVLRQAGAARINVLTMTRTIHADA